ncbi:MAG: O-methyltransferase [Flavobacteriaceae bacterium TMED206]|nr:MAG: O-methyltransferase [Flavobacteriaceae bacterium TMED206]
MNSISEELLKYCITHSSKESEILKELNRQTHIRTLNPRMICGKYQGRFLSIISKIIRPKKILEIGTFTGYSTLCLAEGLDKGGRIDTIDNNFELKKIQNHFFNLSKLQKQINQFTCEAIEIIPKLKDKYDLIFLDADKKNYLNYLELLIPLLRKKGLLVSDNVLWNGKVINTNDNKDLETEVLKKFNQQLSNHKNLETVLLPIRDGISLSVKI